MAQRRPDPILRRLLRAPARLYDWLEVIGIGSAPEEVVVIAGLGGSADRLVPKRTGAPGGRGRGSEDALRMDQWNDGYAPGALTVAVIRLPRISNATDLDPLAAEPGVDVTVTASAMAVATADLVVLPGSRAAGQPFPGGVRTGAIWGTMWHGAFENDEFRRVWLTGIAGLTGAPRRPAAGGRRPQPQDSPNVARLCSTGSAGPSPLTLIWRRYGRHCQTDPVE